MTLTAAMRELAERMTPGPWEAAERGGYSDFDGDSRVISGDDRRIAVVQHDGKDEDEANARVIALADLVSRLVMALEPLARIGNMRPDSAPETQSEMIALKHCRTAAALLTEISKRLEQK